MSQLENAFCRSRAWRLLAQRTVLPWALHGDRLSGEVLEIGTGSGATPRELLQLFPDVRLVATDVDEAMVARARRALEPYAQRAEVVQADATALPFPDGRFDAVLSFLMLHHVGRWEDALAELARVLRSGGRLYAYDLLDGLPARSVHAISRSAGVRLIGLRDLSDRLDELPLGERELVSRGVFFRLRATRTDA